MATTAAATRESTNKEKEEAIDFQGERERKVRKLAWTTSLIKCAILSP